MTYDQSLVDIREKLGDFMTPMRDVQDMADELIARVVLAERDRDEARAALASAKDSNDALRAQLVSARIWMGHAERNGVIVSGLRDALWCQP